ncbi:MAG: hypothetical protein GEU83_08785 [Pseudonocardiaceae bacterium]|nr:hypothetical protein [Pseudonocardiaceae bacterium]
MLTRLRRPGVLPAVMLVIIILWALFAVLMLTNTLVKAGSIDDRVEVINGEVAPIDKELDNVVLAEEVADTSGQIREAAAPLSGQLTQTNDSVKGIDSSAKKILSTAGKINGTAKEINVSVQEINGNVNTIGSTLDSVEGNAQSINGSVDGITASFSGTLAEVVTIDDRLVVANGGVDTLLGQIRGASANIANVTDVQVPAIMTNASGIENSPLLLNPMNPTLLNELAAASLLAQERNAAARPAVPAPVPDLAGLPAPVRQPVPEIGGGILPLGSGESESSSGNDSGSILGGLVGP